MTATQLLYKDLTYAAIGAAMEVHGVLGPGFLESVYETALAHDFDLRGISNRRQPDIAVSYKGTQVGEFRADFPLYGQVIVELKAVKQLTDIHEAQLLNYLKVTGYRVGLLVNFGASSLQHKRRIV